MTESKQELLRGTLDMLISAGPLRSTISLPSTSLLTASLLVAALRFPLLQQIQECFPVTGRSHLRGAIKQPCGLLVAAQRLQFQLLAVQLQVPLATEFED
jgi:hypothetical protein